MNANTPKPASAERNAGAISGWSMLFVNVALLLGAAVWLIRIIVQCAKTNDSSGMWLFFPAILLEILAIILLCGHFTLQPNEARVLILFGAYKGTVRDSGFWWANPFYSRNRARIPLPPESVSHEALKAAQKSPGGSRLLSRPLSAKLSLRARNFNSDRLKVNDKRGNPVEIAAVVVWHVEDTAKAAFDVDDFESYVACSFSENQIKSELLDRASTFFIARLKDKYVGYAKLYQSHPPDCVKPLPTPSASVESCADCGPFPCCWI